MALRTLARRGLEETVVRARGGGATTTTATTGTIAGAWLRFRSDDATTTTTTTGEAGTREANATAEAKATIETLGSEGAPTEERKREGVNRRRRRRRRRQGRRGDEREEEASEEVGAVAERGLERIREKHAVGRGRDDAEGVV